MTAIDNALAEIDALEPGEKLCYQKIATRHGVDRSTLSRRHKQIQAPRATKDTNQQKLNPQQEEELVKYIEGLTARRLPPTRDMIRNFASTIAREPVSDSWVTRFINKHKDRLTPRWTTAMDSVRHAADSGEKYRLYFDLLQHKITEYDVDTEHTYNMDEKGFMIGVVGRSKRIFSKRKWEKKEVRASLQDGNREWITLLACICADGSTLPPGLIYQAAGKAVQSSWVESIDPRKHSVHFTTSPSGWTNDDVGLAWLEQVFDRYTKKKARRKYRLLIVDGHGSHVTMDFIKYCDDNKILLAIFPPHSTHTLQPLDVVCFKPLSSNYTNELAQHTHQTMGWLPIKKGDFFPLFWKAWVGSFTAATVLKSFDATGIAPLNPNKILDRFIDDASEASGSQNSSASCYSGEDWRKIHSLIRSAVKDECSKESRKLNRSFHHISVQNQLLHHEMAGINEVLTTKKKHKKKQQALPLQQRDEYHGGAVFWSPSKRREAEFRQRVIEQEQKEEQLKKANMKALKASNKLYKEKMKEERRVARETAKTAREKEKVEQAAEKARQEKARNAAKAIQVSQKGKRKAIWLPTQKNKRQKPVVDAVASGEAAEGLPTAPAATTRRGRSVNLPKRFE